METIPILRGEAHKRRSRAKLRPQVMLLSVAVDDFNGLPSPETLEALEGYTLLHTDRNGWIELTTDGEQMWLEVEKK